MLDTKAASYAGDQLCIMARSLSQGVIDGAIREILIAALTVVARFPAASGRSATGLTPLVIWLSPLWLHATASCPFCGVHWAFRATCPRSSSTARWDVRDTA